MTHAFQRYTAAGNTFIVMNTWEDPLSLSREAMRALVRIACDYKNGIGTDGMILINQPRGAGQPGAASSGVGQPGTAVQQRPGTAAPRVEQASSPAVAQASPPVVEQASSPAVAQASPPVVEQASSPAVAQASPPVVEQASSPAVAQASPPVVEQASSPAVAQASPPVVEQASSPAVAQTSSSAQADFRMDFYNPDGTTGMLCGNGARCAVEAARAFHFVEGNETRFEVLGAINRGEILPNGAIRVFFQDPVDILLNLELPIEDLSPAPLLGKERGVVTASYVDLGSQHAVIFFEELKKLPILQKEGAGGGYSIDEFPIAQYGALVRWHPEFAPVGVNANFIEVREDGEEKYLRIRTFERGVEGETQACGTGCMSSAIVARLTGRIANMPIRLLTQSGEFVTVNFSVNGEHISGLSLSGPVIAGESGTLIFDEEQHSLDVEYL